MKALAYRIVLHEPVLLTALEGDPNESVSLNYFPGSVLRGALIAKYMEAKGLLELDVGSEEVRRLFFDGRTRYLNGYPLDRQGCRTLPVPLSWYQDKEEVARGTEEKPAPIYDLALNGQYAELKRPQRVKAPFCTLGEYFVRLVNPSRRLYLHTARNRRYGRALRYQAGKEGEFGGAVFRYEALAPGQAFEAVIICEHEADAEIIFSLLKGEVFLGGSRTAGYGRAEIAAARVLPPDWREVSVALAPGEEGLLAVTFLSDALVRDENGQFTVEPRVIAALLARELGVKLEVKRCFVQGQPVGGFNRKWGLPLPQALAIKMGSVLVCSLPAGAYLEAAKLQELEARGIGERRAEGFGRLAFNWLWREKWKVEGKISEVNLEPDIVHEEGKKLAGRMLVRLFQRRMEEKLALKAVGMGRVLGQVENFPSRAQVARLRGVIRTALMKNPPDLEAVKSYLRDLKGRRTARRQWQGAKMEGQTLLEWLEGLCGKVEVERWKDLFELRAKDIPSLGNLSLTLDESLRRDYLLRFMDAVLAYALLYREREEGRS